MPSKSYDYDAVSFDRDELRTDKDMAPQPSTISELIEVLELIENEHGDLPVENHYLSLSISPEVINGVVTL